MADGFLVIKLNLANIEDVRKFSRKVMEIQDKNLISSLQICKTGATLELVAGVSVNKNEGSIPGLYLVRYEIEEKHFPEIKEITETDVIENISL